MKCRDYEWEGQSGSMLGNGLLFMDTIIYRVDIVIYINDERLISYIKFKFKEERWVANISLGNV